MCLHISTEKKKNQSSFSEKSPKPLIAKKILGYTKYLIQ